MTHGWHLALRRGENSAQEHVAAQHTTILPIKP